MNIRNYQNDIGKINKIELFDSLLIENIFFKNLFLFTKDYLFYTL